MKSFQTETKIILASKSKVRKKILEKNNIRCIVQASNIDEEPVKNSLLKKINDKKHYLISSVCISKNGSMIWNYTDKAKLTMKNFSEDELKNYLSKITDETLYAYNVYQIEGEGRALFSKIDGNEDTIMGLPIKKIKEYLELQK